MIYFKKYSLVTTFLDISKKIISNISSIYNNFVLKKKNQIWLEFCNTELYNNLRTDVKWTYPEY